MKNSGKSAAKKLSALSPNSAWASLPLFDRTGWKRMAFGEFAESIGERAEPKDAQEEIYVGLEHLDPQCLQIRHWGKGSDVIGGKLRFRKAACCATAASACPSTSGGRGAMTTIRMKASCAMCGPRWRA